MKKLLYINNELVDLYPGTVIAQTLQAFELGALGSVRTNYTNQIRIPKTGTNRRALGFSENSKSSTTFPYTTHTARYIENGIEIIRNGIIDLKETSDDFLLTILSGPVGFFDFIKTKKLWDLDFSTLNGAWASSDIDAKRNATTGIVAPLVNDGHLALSGSDIVNYLNTGVGSGIKMPMVYYHTIIDKIFSTAGYTKSGAIFSDANYLNLVMPLRVHYNDEFVEAKKFLAAAIGTQVIVDPATYVNVQFPDVAYIGADNFYNGIDEYQVTNLTTSAFYFEGNFEALINITVSGGTVNMILEITSTGATSHTRTGIGSGTYTFEGTTLNGMRHGDIARVKVIKNSGTPTVTINSGTFWQKHPIVDNMVRSTITPYYCYFNLLFEDIYQIDFLKDFSIRFNVRMIERNGVIICKTMNEILADTANMLDWTDKQIPGTEKLRYAYGGLAQENYFTYSKDSLAQEVTEDYGKGVFTISNENIKESNTVYNSLMLISQMVSAFNVFMADLDRGYDSVTTGAYENDIGIKLLYVRDRYAHEPSALYQVATPRTDYKVGYFIDPKQTRSMHWQYFIDNYYADFVTKLQKAKAITRRYRLNDLDIHTFDQLKLVHDSGETFIVTKINNYVSGKSVEVELFKVD